MRKFLLKGSYAYEIRKRRANPYPYTEKEFLSYFDALSFLRGFLLDRSDMTTLREVLAGDLAGRGPDGLTDYEVIEQLARRFISGDLCVAARHDRFPPGEGGGGEAESSVKSYQFEYSSPPPPAPETPPRPGPSVTKAGTQAKALKQAAKSGSPFCEA